MGSKLEKILNLLQNYSRKKIDLHDYKHNQTPSVNEIIQLSNSITLCGVLVIKE